MATIEIAKRTATRPTWAEVSLGTLRRNFRAVQQHISAGVTVCAIVKADAYGHGAVECAQALEQEGARWFGVTSLDEAIPLREAGIRGRILLMTGFWRGEEEEIVRLGLTPTVWETGQIELFEKAATALGVAKHPIHLKVDTGMGRLGAAPEDLPRICAVLESSPHLLLEGLSTHLASSEVLDEPSVAAQMKSFDEVRDFLRNEGFNPPLIHAANTGAVISRPESWNTMVRPGIALCGETRFDLENPHSLPSRYARQPGPGLRRNLRHKSSRAHCRASGGIRRWLKPQNFVSGPSHCG